ncbi:phytanoyl-CoA dioxygenase family protein [Kaistia adipata]|uniref:phytanoyl-CoA dioxygenase family protein n=1 Tax=Kaistia adipata TaxID=166954 RepID=UPI00040EEC1A|nr:phytanoyl-CoA dioxygenase family protein [Kaistia adipata]
MTDASPVLTDAEIEGFVANGFVRLDAAFPSETALAARAILWRDTGCNPGDPSSWTRPVVRLGEYGAPPFAEAANAPRLRAAFDQLVGEGRWLPRRTLGSFPIRFPSEQDPGDAGWHVDASFPGSDPVNYLAWCINAQSKGRALLMLFLFSDVSEADAPTRIRVGSHRDVARVLAPEGEAGLDFMELAGRLAVTEGRGETLATGPAGTVYLCHPLLAHAAQPHRGHVPRFMAQPPLLPRGPLDPWRADGAASPVERAIRLALEAGA